VVPHARAGRAGGQPLLAPYARRRGQSSACAAAMLLDMIGRLTARRLRCCAARGGRSRTDWQQRRLNTAAARAWGQLLATSSAVRRSQSGISTAAVLLGMKGAAHSSPPSPLHRGRSQGGHSRNDWQEWRSPESAAARAGRQLLLASARVAAVTAASALPLCCWLYAAGRKEGGSRLCVAAFAAAPCGGRNRNDWQSGASRPLLLALENCC